MTAPTPRDVLDGLPPATCYRTHTQPDESLGVYGAVWKADVVRTITRREPLDVERLRALADELDSGLVSRAEAADIIRAVYARLEAEG